MDAEVGGQLGVEGGGEDVVLADEDGRAFALGEGLDCGAGAGDPRGADEDHLDGLVAERGLSLEDGGVDLASVGVALDGNVEGGERRLCRVENFRGEEDDSGAGAEGGFGADEGVEGGEEAVALEVLEEGGGFAAGKDDAVEVFEFGWIADEDGSCAGSSEGFGVGFEGALQGENADFLWLRDGVPPPVFWCKIFKTGKLGSDLRIHNEMLLVRVRESQYSV